MATSYAVPAVGAAAGARTPPKLSVLRSIAIAGLLTGACSLAFALTNDGVSGVQVALLEWISIPYIAAGLVAWWRRPDSGLGVLMVVGGFADGVSVPAGPPAVLGAFVPVTSSRPQRPSRPAVAVLMAVPIVV